MSLVRYLQFTCPILGMLIYVASYASEHWITLSDTAHRWGLLTKCQPGSVNGTVTCRYMSPSESEGYFVAAQCFSSIAMVLYFLLLFNYKLLKVKVARHQLPALHAGILSFTPSQRWQGLTSSLCVSRIATLIAIVLLLVGVNYKDDSRWKGQQPSLGWSYWVSVPACLLALLSTVSLIIRGQRTHRDSVEKRKKTISSKDATDLRRSGSRVHPGDTENGHAGAKRLPDQQQHHHQQQPAKTQQQHGKNDSNDDTHEDPLPREGGASERGTDSDDVSSDQHQQQQQQLPKRQWKRRLTPISLDASGIVSGSSVKEPGFQGSLEADADDPYGHRACVHPVPDIVVTPNSPVQHSESD